MRVRLTDIKRTKTKHEKKPQAARFVEADSLTIGRGTDCDVNLSGLDVKYHHAGFSARQGKVFLEKLEADAVAIERRDAAGRVESHEATSGKEVAIGDILRIGRYEITVAPPGEGEALALEIEEVEKPVSDREEVEKRYQRGVERGLFRRRPLSWAIAIAIAALFWFAPLLVSRGTAGRAGSDAKADARHGEPTGEPASAAGALPGGAVPVAQPSSDRLARWLDETWNVGPIASKHGAVPCAACHAKAWQRVDDAACASLGCHADVGGHVGALGADGWQQTIDDRDGGALARCVHCHAEHRGEDGLVKTGDRYCTSCHAGLIDQKVAHPTFLGVEGFLRHPEFRPSLIEVETITSNGSRAPAPAIVKQVCGGAGEKRGPAAAAGANATGGCAPARQRLAIGSPELRDLGVGLIFPHDVHLAANLRGFAKGEYSELACASCHSLARGGEVMTKVTYAKNCQTCHWHSLRFSEAAGSLEAPHPAQIDEVRRAIGEFFLAQELRDLPATQVGGKPLFLRPGAGGDRSRDIAVADARRRAEAKADLEATALIDGQCRSCHVFDGEGATLRVRPIFLIPLDASDRWLPYGAFNHEKHGDVKYPAPSGAKLDCESCHAARDPEHGHRAELILLPPIEECRKCHVGEAPEPNMVVSNCLMCHEFHHKRYGPMRADERTAAALRMFPASRERAS